MIIGFGFSPLLGQREQLEAAFDGEVEGGE